MSTPDDDLGDIPILLEPVSGPPAAGAEPGPAAGQTSLFADLPDDAPALAGRAPRRSAAQVRREALELLAARAPAIVGALVDAEAERLSALLRERLQAEFRQLLQELAED